MKNNNAPTLRSPEFIRLHIAFKEWLSILGYAEGTIVGTPKNLHIFFRWLEENNVYSSNTIEQEYVELFLQDLSQRTNLRNGNALGNGYLNKFLQAIKLFATYLRENNLPSFNVDIVQFPVKHEIKDILTIEEIQLLYDTTENSAFGLRDKAMLGLYYGCGLRRSEGLKLDTDDILIDRKLLYVRNGKNYTERYVPIHPYVLKNFVDYMQYGREELNRNKSTAFLLSERGDRIQGQSIMLRLRGLIEKTGNEKLMNKNLGLHSLRHSIATHLLLQGMKLERVGQFLGHKSIESTQIYTHVAAEYYKQ